MVPMIEPYNVLTILYWLVMFAIALFVLVRVTGYFAEDTPGTLGKAALTTRSPSWSSASSRISLSSSEPA
jgi:hypothetical protein